MDRGHEARVVVHARPKFIGSRRIAVKGRELEAERIFINVSAARRGIPIFPASRTLPFFTNSSIMKVISRRRTWCRRRQLHGLEFGSVPALRPRR